MHFTLKAKYSQLRPRLVLTIRSVEQIIAEILEKNDHTHAPAPLMSLQFRYHKNPLKKYYLKTQELNFKICKTLGFKLGRGKTPNKCEGKN